MRISPSLVLRVFGIVLLLGAVIVGAMSLLNWICPALAIWVGGAAMGGFLVTLLFTEKVMPQWEQQIEREAEARQRTHDEVE